MTTLNLGVYDVPYAVDVTFGRASRRYTVTRAQRGYGTNKTTGLIAEVLEGRYGIMRAFYENRKNEVIIPAVVDAVRGSAINVMMGQPGPIDVTAEAMSTIEASFKESLSMNRYDQWIPRGGQFPIPTLASGRNTRSNFGTGRSVRFKGGWHLFKGRKASRPSFINSGLYQSVFAAWMT
jgi:hypothetical protein